MSFRSYKPELAHTRNKSWRESESYNLSAFLVTFTSVRVRQIGKQLDALMVNASGLFVCSKLDAGVGSFSHREGILTRSLAIVAYGCDKL
jgi:hypothetical protein